LPTQDVNIFICQNPVWFIPMLPSADYRYLIIILTQHVDIIDKLDIWRLYWTWSKICQNSSRNQRGRVNFNQLPIKGTCVNTQSIGITKLWVRADQQWMTCSHKQSSRFEKWPIWS